MDIKICQEKLMELPGLVIEKVRVSFLERLFPKILGNSKVLLISQIDPQVEKRISPKKEADDANSMLDITGSPLQHSFGDDNFNVSIATEKRNWLRSEEKYTPISLKMAIELVTSVADEFNERELADFPIFCLVDAKESNRTNDKCLIIGNNPIPKGFMTIRVSYRGLRSLDQLADLGGLMDEHRIDNMNPNPSKKEQVSILSIHELCGYNQEMIDSTERDKSDFGRHLRIESSWEEPCFLPVSRKSSSTLIASIASGLEDSPLSSLWNEILLLDKYLSILEQYRKRYSTSRYSIAPLNFPKDFINPFTNYATSATKRVRRLLAGYEDLDDPESIEDEPATETSSDDNYVIKIIDLIKILDKRHNQDFTDLLWRIIKTTDSYTTMTDCMHMVFQEIIQHNFKPQLNVSDDTRFAKLVNDLNFSKQLPQLAGIGAMELVIDMGMEKLGRDYAYLLSTGNLMEVYDVRRMLNNLSEGEFIVESYRGKLMTLAQIHISLEFLQLIQDQLHCRMDLSHMIFERALNIYSSQNSPVQPDDLKNQKIYTLTVPAPRDFVNEVMKSPPSSWMCSLTTTTKDQDISTISHYSRTPIFPPNILEIGDNQKLDEELGRVMYYTTKAKITHFKLG